MDFDDALRDLFESNKYKQDKLPSIPDLKEGQEIYHKKFGKGFIINVNGDKCDVLFEYSIKTLLSRFAEFKII